MTILQQGMNYIVLAAGTNSDTMNLYVKAVMNTLLGMGIVFIVLISISYIISLLKYIPKFLEKNNNKENIKNIKSVSIETTNNQSVFMEKVIDTAETDQTNNAELVAVITAAIMASIGNEVPKDMLIVRSIRKINRR